MFSSAATFIFKITFDFPVKQVSGSKNQVKYTPSRIQSRKQESYQTPISNFNAIIKVNPRVLEEQ